MGSQHLFAHASDRQHAPAQGDLAGHANFLVDRSPGQRGDERGGQRDTCRWAILRDGALRHVHVDVHALEHFQVDPQQGRPRFDVGQRGLARFLHHIPDLTGHLQVALAIQHGHFDRI